MLTTDEQVELAKLMVEWSEARRKAIATESRIKELVLKNGKSVSIAGVEASYYGGRTKYHYTEAVAQAIKDDNEAVITAVTRACVPGNLKESVFSAIAKEAALLVKSTKTEPTVSVALHEPTPDDSDLPGHWIISGGDMDEVR